MGFPGLKQQQAAIVLLLRVVWATADVWALELSTAAAEFCSVFCVKEAVGYS